MSPRRALSGADDFHGTGYEFLRRYQLDANDIASNAAGRPRYSADPVTKMDCDGNAFFEGELEPCINGQVGAVGAYFGLDVRRIIARLRAEQLPDGGWLELRGRQWWSGQSGGDRFGLPHLVAI